MDVTNDSLSSDESDSEMNISTKLEGDKIPVTLIGGKLIDGKRQIPHEIIKYFL